MNDISVTLSADDRALLQALREAGVSLDQFARKGAGALRDMETASHASATGIEKLAGGLKTAFIGGGVAAAIITIKNAIGGVTMAMIDAQMQADKVKNSLAFAMGGAQAAQEIQYLRQVTDQLGVSFSAVAPMYGRLAAATKGTNLEGRATREIFESIAQASVVMGLGVEETEGAMRALVQMVSKGQIQAEELRGQLGERLPRAFQIFADSMGVTTGELSKLLEMGQVGPERLAQFAATLKGELAGNLDEATTRLAANVNRLDNAWLQLKQNVGEAGVSSFMAGQMAILADATGDVAKSMEAARKGGDGFLGQMAAAGGALLRFANPFNAITYNVQDQATELKIAQDQLREYEALLAKDPTNTFLIRGIAQIKETVAWLQAANAEKNKFAATGPSRRTMEDNSMKALAEQQAKDAKELADIKAKLMGVDKDYLPTLNKLNDAYRAGNLTQKEYVGLVGELAKKNYTAAKATAAHADGLEDVRAAAKVWADVIKDADKNLLDATGATDELTKSEKRLQEYLESFAYSKNSEEMRKMALEHLNAAIAAERQSKAIKAVNANEEAYAKMLDGHAKEIDSMVAANEALRLQNELIGLSTDAVSALTLARMDAAIEEQKIAIIVAKSNDIGEARIAQMERELVLLEQRRILTYDGQRATATSDAAKRDLEALADLWKSFDNTAHDVFVNIFNDGSNAFKKLGQSLKAGLIDVLYQLTLKRWIINIGASVTGLGGVTAAQAAGTGANLLSGGSSALSTASNVASIGALFGAGGIGGSLAAGAGWLTGATSLSGSLSAGLSLLGTQTVAGSMAGAGMIAGALAPIALGIAAVYALAKKLDHSCTPHTGGGSSYSAVAGLSSTTTSGWTGGSSSGDGFGSVMGSASTVEMTSGLVKSIVGILDSTATAFGKTAGYAAATSFADDSSKDPAWGSLVIKQLDNVLVNWNDTRTSKWAPRRFSDGSAGSAEYLAAVSQDVRKALDSIDLPEWADKMLGKLGASASLEDLAKVVSEINQTQAVLQSLGASVKVFAGLSGDAVLNIINASGGLQAFGASLGAYYENFYSEQEKFDTKLQSLNTRLQDLAAGGAFADSSDAFFRAITEPTRENFRKLIEAQDLTTTSGQATYAALLSLSGVVAELTPVTEAAAEAVQTLGTAALTLADLQKQFDSAAKTILNSTEYTAYRIQQIQQTLSAAGMDLSAQQITHATREQVLAGYQQALAAGNIEAASAILNVLDALTEVSAGFQGVTETSTSAAVAVQQVVTTLADVQGLFGNAARTLLNDVQYTAYQVAQIQATLGSVGINVTAADIQNATREQVLAGLSEMMAAGNLDAARAILSVVGALSEVSSGFQTVAATASNAAAVMQQRAGLESTLLNLTGNTAEIRAREMAALDASNRGLQQHIYAIQDAQQAVQDANSAYAAQESALNGLQSAAQRWIGTLGTASNLLDQISGALGGAGGNREASLWATVNGAGDIDARLSAAQELYGLITQTARTEAAAQDNALSNAKALLEYGQRLRDYVQGLKTGDLSTLTPAQKVAEALAQYQTTLAAAQGGDQTALGRLQGVADTYLRLAREFDPASYTTSVFTSVTDALDSLGAGLVSQNQPQIDLLQSQLDATRAASASANSLSADQIARLTTLQTVVQDLQAQAGAQSAIANAQLSSAQAQLQTLGAAQVAAQQAVLSAQQAATAYMATLADVAVTDPVPDILLGLPAGIAAALAPLINANPASTAAAAAATTAQRAQIIRDYAATLPQDDGGARLLYDAAVANGVGSAELDAAMGFAPGSSLAWAVSHGLPAFAQGTNYVPRDMLAQIHQGEAIVPARYNPANGGNAELVAEIKALREEVRILREQNNAGHQLGAMATHENTQQITRATVEAASKARHTQHLQQRAALA